MNVRVEGHALERPQTIPVPRGPNIHLCVPATKKSQPRSGRLTFSTPSPCTPSTQRSTRSDDVLLALIVARASAILRIGSFTPVLECTQVRATTRVEAVTGEAIVGTIRSTEAVAGLS